MAFQPLLQRPHLQLIVDGRNVDDLAALVRAAAWGGVDSIQIREKGAGAQELLERTLVIAQVLRVTNHRVSLLVNDRLDVALLAKANGVHLPETSFSPEQVAGYRRLAGDSRFIVGRSIHDHEATRDYGTEQLDYLLFGHIFSSASKFGIPPRGLDALTRVASQSPVPVLAVGGISTENAGSVLSAGAAGVAVISAITAAPDPYEATVALRRALLEQGCRKEDSHADHGERSSVRRRTRDYDSAVSRSEWH